MKTAKWMKWLLLLAGILLIIVGVVLFTRPIETYVGLAAFISVAIMFSGISDIISYFSQEKIFRSGAMLAGGIISLVFGVLLVAKPEFFTGLLVIIPIIFAGWIISSGVARAVGALDLKRFGFRGWGWIMAIAVINIILGVWLMFSPTVAMGTISLMIPVLFIVHGINSVMMFFGVNRIGRFFKDRKDG